MDLFEFVLTGLTLLLALVTTRLLGGLRWVLRPDRADWVHALMVLDVLALTSLLWWGLWYLHDVEWSYGAFFYNLLVGPGVLYFLATLLVPDYPRRVRDWREYNAGISGQFWGAFALLIVVIFIGSIAIDNTPLWHFTRAIEAVGLVAGLIGAFSRRRGVHAALTIVLTLLVIAASVISGMRTPPQ
ncbi:MAG: hypothetical protein AAF515_11600 [Pseudomonadota bacterium]